MEPKMVITLFFCAIVLLLFVGTPLKPIRFFGYGAIKLMIGALFLFVLNAIGTSFNIHVPINLLTSFISGFLGIPGVAALVIIQKYILL
ncbi:sigma-K factor-processing regulatory protein BofA [Anoxybacillus sp. B7M1]|jgi:inhibitor of the pro-sigma K processing machinery|uniref:Pro-sigmaK processing inhibitor BofA family protein n=1 Tax=Anoxybacteroides rupiense TaxID=311460 RepID=A0ABD5IWK5_9BACL|nr:MULTISPECIES: pro-sigmaK processing inhibitor BofA family protein [Anoxybacillus]ANB57167.1 sigma-K factor-processing regulatory protein BofA [Anoxybacillus sp. B2M1]ANB64050.1 sigma-K factor-processing regulatory protein BofA [Anoxybacillus sp. B7M1]MBB3909354.1 inhibitor of the pro-sigma K processing machinery [Anoxybacillus rupiensis]MBS2773193.1 pro-sigmaK processing inhibitor BofA family protein [Anoxybacillus rupiensis]MDE8565706.1 pro-sigmaK processing inhibitor BofA family protein [